MKAGLKIPCAECGLPVTIDWPSLDGTDGAHPAWWRGDDHGVHAACKVLEDVLDNGMRGQFASPELQALAVRLDGMRIALNIAQSMIDEQRWPNRGL